MARLQYNGPDTDVLKRGGVYERDEHPGVDDEEWCTPAVVEAKPKPKAKPDDPATT